MLRKITFNIGALLGGGVGQFALTIGAGAAACNLSELNSIDGMKRISHIIDVTKQYPRQIV